MNFAEAQQEYQRLRSLYSNQELTLDAFAHRVRKLVLLDPQGVKWQLGVLNGRWYRLNGTTWEEAAPVLDASTGQEAAKVETPQKPIEPEYTSDEAIDRALAFARQQGEMPATVKVTDVPPPAAVVPLEEPALPEPVAATAQVVERLPEETIKFPAPVQETPGDETVNVTAGADSKATKEFEIIPPIAQIAEPEVAAVRDFQEIPTPEPVIAETVKIAAPSLVPAETVRVSIPGPYPGVDDSSARPAIAETLVFQPMEKKTAILADDTPVSRQKPRKRAWILAAILAPVILCILVAVILGPKAYNAIMAVAVPSAILPTAQIAYTVTPVPATAQPATATAEPSAIPTATLERPTLQATIDIPNVPWKMISSVYFNGKSDLSGGWETLGGIPVEYQFLNDYLGLPALQVSYDQPALLPGRDLNGKVARDLVDVEIEANLAFPEPGDGSSILMIARYLDEGNYYALKIQPGEWAIIKMENGISTTLSRGGTNPELGRGGWGWLRFGCLGSHLYVWDEIGAMVDIPDAKIHAGGTAIMFVPGDSTGVVNLYFHRVLARSK
jgi:hypothetical protein